MIVGDVASWSKEEQAFSRVLAKGIEYLLSNDFGSMESGKYEIEGERFFALIQEPVTEPWADRRPEAHDRYIDIQYLYEGEGEVIGVARRSPDLVPSEDYLGSRDVAFFSDVKDESRILLRPGMFAVFFPDDIHRPCCAVGERGSAIKKVVLKIEKTLL